MLVEKDAKAFSGWLMLAVLLVAVATEIFLLVTSAQAGNAVLIVTCVVALLLTLLCLGGLTVVNPNLSKVVILAGTYKGTIKQQGFWWVNPVSSRRRVSLRIRNFES